MRDVTRVNRDGAQCIALATSLGTRLLRILKTSAFRGCKSGTSFIDIVKKLSSLTLIRSHLKIASEAYFKRDQKTFVKCLLGDVWSKVTTE